MGGSGTISLIVSTGIGTITRAEMRRMLCQELHMPFMRRFNGTSTVGSDSVSPHNWFVDTNLVQPDDYWNEHWWFNTRNGEVRKVVDYSQSNNRVYLEYPASAIFANDTYELHAIWNAHELHAAINRAIEDAYPSFFDVVTDESLSLKENTLTYPLTGLSSSPWIITKVWIENPASPRRGTATGGTASTLTDTSASFSDLTTDYKVSIYAGAGAGQVRTVTSASGSVIDTSSDSSWSPIPDSTSKYIVWNAADQQADWSRIQNVRFNSKENPTAMYLTDNYISSLGARIRVEYVAKPAALLTETSTTSIPKEFILHKALYYLFSQKVNDNRADRSRYESLSQRHFELAEIYRQSHSTNMPDITFWTPAIRARGFLNYDGNPFNWGGH